MKRITIFLVILTVSIAALIATTAIGFVIFSSQQQNPANWMSQMFGGSTSGMAGMMGGQTGVETASNALLPYFGVLFAVLIAIVVFGVLGLGYYILYPQIRVGTVGVIQTTQNLADAQQTPNDTAFDSIARTLNPEELKVLEVLNQHNGKYLQKYIKTETGLSRLKTHRIIARLSERGIVSLEKVGNTNQVYLASWLNQTKIT